MFKEMKRFSKKNKRRNCLMKGRRKEEKNVEPKERKFASIENEARAVIIQKFEIFFQCSLS